MKNEPIIKERPKKRRKSGKNRNLNLIIFVLIFLALIVAIPYYFFAPKPETYYLKQFEVAEVTTQDFVKSVNAEGKVVASKQFVLTSPETSQVIEVLQEPGDMVVAGQILFKLDTSALEEDLKEAQDEYDKNMKKRKQTQLDYERRMAQLEKNITDARKLYEKLKQDLPTWNKLYDLGQISESQIETKRQEVADAQENIEQAKMEKEYAIQNHQLNLEELDDVVATSKRVIDTLNEDIAKSEIRCEGFGKIIKIPIEVGDTVQKGAVLAEIIDEQSLVIAGKVSQNQISYIETGQFVKIMAGDTYAGEVISIAEVANDSMVDIEVHFIGKPPQIRPQTSANLDIQIATLEDRLALPRGRYLSSGMERFAYVIDGEKAIKKEVTFGLVDGNYIEVKAGLEKDDSVIVSSYDNFIDLEEIDINPEGGIEL